MDPYRPPDSSLDEPNQPISDDAPMTVTLDREVRVCEECGSGNTVRPLEPSFRMGIFAFLLFGWLSIWVRIAFETEKVSCLDCDHVSSHRSTGSSIALGLLIAAVIIVALAVAGGA